jgi:hypothetical protein
LRQILAWNGGGSSNISEIFSQPHKSEAQKVAAKAKDFLKSELDTLEQMFTELK